MVILNAVKDLGARDASHSLSMTNEEMMKPYLHLMRLDKPIGIWLVFFPAAWGVLLAPAALDPALLGLMLLGAVLVRAAGCILNDLADRKLDAHVARTRTRPLASGAVSVRQALLLLALLLVGALALALRLPPMVFWLGLLALPLIAAYPWMKRFTFWPQAFLGLTFNLGAPIGWAATGAPLELAALLLYVACLFWTLGYDTIYALQDRADDKQAGIKSTARALEGQMRPAVTACYIAMLALLAAAFVQAGAPPVAYGGLALAGLHAGWQCLRLNEHDPDCGGRIFRSNQWLGLILLGALLLGRVGV